MLVCVFECAFRVCVIARSEKRKARRSFSVQRRCPPTAVDPLEGLASIGPAVHQLMIIHRPTTTICSTVNPRSHIHVFRDPKRSAIGTASGRTTNDDRLDSCCVYDSADCTTPISAPYFVSRSLSTSVF